MFKTILVDVDTQFDFVDPKGALYVPAADDVRKNIQFLSQCSLPTIGSVDSHAYDAWEFSANGGPFPPHCVKGTAGWLKIAESMHKKTRFIPMATDSVIGEAQEGLGPREYTAQRAAKELFDGVALYLEKEVYSLFFNPFAKQFIEAISNHAKNTYDKEVEFAVFGYCTGGFCVDAAAKGLAELGYKTSIIMDATAPLEAKGGTPKTTIPMCKKHNISMITTKDLLT